MDSHLLLSLFHIFAVVPLLLYVAINRADTAKPVYGFLLVLGTIVTLYHAYKGWNRYISGSTALWISVLHFLYVGPLLMYIGYKEKDTPRYVYEVLAIVAFGALGYHTYHLIMSMNIIMDDAKNKV
jgi:hypothetical protein